MEAKRDDAGERAQGELVSRSLVADASDIARLRDCFARNSERQRSQAHFEWLYLRNPSRQMFVDVATTADGRVVAVYASLPSWVRAGEQRSLVLQSLDTLTDREYRGRGLFVSLARSLYRRAQAAGCALIYGFPNGNSAHGFFAKLDWSRLDPVPFLVRPLRLRYGASKLEALRRFERWLPDVPLVAPWAPTPPGSRLVTLARFDERVTALWTSFRAGRIQLAVERDAAYFDWRIADKPDETYRTLALERKDGTLDALCTFTVKDKHGGRIGYVMELLYRPGATLSGVALLARAVRDMAREGADALLAWCLPQSPNIAGYHLNGFVPLPTRLRDIELHFGAHAFQPAFTSQVAARAAWYVSYLDSDTV
ncbi:MAG: GNAT family N-acetyltransferase [Polyangiaceae bacterium]